jgi:hypothetical protein
LVVVNFCAVQSACKSNFLVEPFSTLDSDADAVGFSHSICIFNELTFFYQISLALKLYEDDDGNLCLARI